MESRELFHLKTVHSSKFIWQVQVHMKRQRLPKRDILTTDLTGYAQSKKIPYGTYVVHQTVGATNTEKCPDFYVNVKENGKTYKYLLNNPNSTHI